MVVLAAYAGPQTEPGGHRDGGNERAELNRSAGQYLGAGSCATNGCHGGRGGPQAAGSEYNVWLGHDPHARAYEVLLGYRSRRMAELLGLQQPAHEAAVCLACHAAAGENTYGWTPAFAGVTNDAPHLVAEGVSCEACHGPAGGWLDRHPTANWKQLSIAEKTELGMVDTDDLDVRLARCLQCHVSGPDGEVDHELLAAGHPRLAFEAGVFHANWPKHWPGPTDPEELGSEEAKIWAAGQVATLRARMELLAHRAVDDSRPWPELSEYDCFGCHRGLRSEGSPAQGTGAGRRGSLGSLVWNRGPTALLEILGESGPAAAPAGVLSLVDRVQATMESAVVPDRAKVADEALRTARELGQWTKSLAGADYSPAVRRRLAARLARQVADAPALTWDGVVATYLAVAALELRIERGSNGLAAVEPAELLGGLRGALQWKPDYDSPVEFRPEQARAELSRIAQAIEP